MFSAIIPHYHAEFASGGGDIDFHAAANKPSARAEKAIAVRINVAGSGTLKLVMSGVTVAYDGCVVGEILVGEFTSMVDSGTDVTSYQVYYV